MCLPAFGDVGGDGAAENRGVEAAGVRADGFRVEASIVTWEAAQVLKLPAGALFRRHEEWVAFIIRQSRVELVPVEIGHTNGIETEIRSGLQPGDQVIVHPSDRVTSGVRVTPR